MGSRILVRLFVAFVFFSLPFQSVLVDAQGLPQSPYSAPSAVRGRLDLAPSNPLGMPAAIGQSSSDSILVTQQMFQGILPTIPNLQAGYLYYFGKDADTGRLTLDFLQPVSLGADTVVFGEAHAEFTNFWKMLQRLVRSGGGGASYSAFNDRTDLSFGGGYRTIYSGNTLVGVNGFFDTTRLGSRWYSSGSVGFEAATLLPGADALDVAFNWYGNLFNTDVLANAFRRGPQNYDFQAGYSHELWNGGPDLRLSVTGYRFSSGSAVYGGRAGAELKSRNGMFSAKYEAAHDRINGAYHTVGGFVNVGFQLSNLLNGESPFVMPEPIFKSPRNLRRWLTRSTREIRDGNQPVSSILSRSQGSASQVGCLSAGSIDYNNTYPATTQGNSVTRFWTWTPAGSMDPNAAAASRTLGYYLEAEIISGTNTTNLHVELQYVYANGNTSVLYRDGTSLAGVGAKWDRNFTVANFPPLFPPLTTEGCITGINVILSNDNSSVQVSWTATGNNTFAVP